ncbi:MAG: bactofilin family protein [Pikeienuella sp.]
MFSKSKINEPEKKPAAAPAAAPAAKPAAAPAAAPAAQAPAAAAPKAKPSPSVISTDLKVQGNLITSGDIQVEGTIEGDIRAHLLTVGQSATISGEVVADDIVVHGHVRGRVRGLKVRLTSSAQVEGDIIHKTIAIESGAHFEGSVQRAEDPLKTDAKAEVKTD